MKKTTFLLCIMYIYYIFLISFTIFIFFEFMKEMVPLFSGVFFGLDLTTEKTRSEIFWSEFLFYTLFIILLILSILYFVLLIINFISLKANSKNNNTELLLKKTNRIKFGLIPFWIINFICYIYLMSYINVISFNEIKVLGFFNFLKYFLYVVFKPWAYGEYLIIPIFTSVSYMFLCLTSIFSIVFIVNLRKNKLLSNKQFIINILLQLFFLTDIISIKYINKKIKQV
jgi:hypothetical protein